jgi:hypothetical protein
MTSGMLAVVTFLSSFLFFVGAVFFSKVRQFLAATGIFIMVAGFTMVFSNWLPQIPDPGPLTPIKIVLAEIEKMPAQELADLGEVVIFGKVGGYEMRAIGKGQCPLCHMFKKGDIGDRAPNLIGIVSRAAKRIKEPRYLHPDTVQLESSPGVVGRRQRMNISPNLRYARHVMWWQGLERGARMIARARVSL